jgi:acetyl-CoA acetyltransferase
MTRVGIMGVGLTPFDKHEDVSVEELACRAIVAAMWDAGCNRDEVQAAFFAHLYQGEVLGQRSMRALRFPAIPVTNVENACAGGSTAVREAYLSVARGQFDLALAVGAEKMGRGLINFVSADVELALGNTAPAQYALAAQRHAFEYGTKPESFAGVAVKNRHHAALNPNARFREPVTLEEVLAARVIAEPLTLLQCCRNGTGAAAVVIASERMVRRRGGVRVWIEGNGLASWMFDKSRQDLTSFGATRAAANAAYESAGVGPEDVDVIELHDAFTAGELLHYEGLGLCPKGDAARMVADGDTSIDGRVPVNLSGGLIGKSHPLGATGVAQFAELVWQLRGEATGRQADNPRMALAHSQGGTGLEAGATCVTILSRES